MIEEKAVLMVGFTKIMLIGWVEIFALETIGASAPRNGETCKECGSSDPPFQLHYW